MIGALIVAIILIAILCVVGRLMIDIIKPPEPLGKVIWAVVIIVSLLVLLNVFAPGAFNDTFNWPR